MCVGCKLIPASKEINSLIVCATENVCNFVVFTYIIQGSTMMNSEKEVGDSMAGDQVPKLSPHSFLISSDNKPFKPPTLGLKHHHMEDRRGFGVVWVQCRAS